MSDTNPIIELSPDQTSELLAIWLGQKDKLTPDDFLFIKVKINRPQAKLTKTQTYRMVMNLAKSGYEPIPEWLLQLLDPTE